MGLFDRFKPGSNQTEPQAASFRVVSRAGQQGGDGQGNRQSRTSANDLSSVPGIQQDSAQLSFANDSLMIDSLDQFSKLPLTFEAVIQSIELGPHISSHICPVLFGGPEGGAAAQATVLVTPAYANSDELLEVLRQIHHAEKSSKHKARWRVWNHARILIVPDILLLSISRGVFDKSAHASRRDIAGSKIKSGLLRNFTNIIAWALEQNASDVHFVMNEQSPEHQSKVHFTIFGRYVAPKQWHMETVTMSEMMKVAYMISTGGSGPDYDPKSDMQYSIGLQIGEHMVVLRAGAAATGYPGPSVTMRLLVTNQQGHIQSLEQLGYMPSHLGMAKRAMTSEKGAIIFAGVVGSGKTHSLASMMSRIPPHRKAMGVEDPVELIIPNVLQRSLSRRLDEDDTNAFSSFLKTIKRSAMNDLLLGEIRDIETAKAFVDMVLTGTSVYTTTHAPSAMGVYDKLASDTIGISRDFLASPDSIKLIVYQALLPRNCPHCALPLADEGEECSLMALLHELYELDTARLRKRNPEGCQHCRHDSIPELNGFSGRELVAEMIEPDPQVLDYVKRSDAVGLAHYLSSLRGDVRYDEPEMRGKSAMECAVYKASQGLIDPREIEPRFHSFEKERIIREARNRFDLARIGGHKPSLLSHHKTPGVGPGASWKAA